MTLLGYLDYRTYLKDELSNRCRHNSNYSLRAFARDLKLSSARMSEVLSGKKGLSRVAAADIGKLLKMNTAESEYFCDLVEVAHARSSIAREAALKRIQEYKPTDSVKNLDEDSFKIVSDWYHFAILNLMHLKDFKSNPEWISSRLGITHDTVLEALSRMLRLKMISYDGGHYHPEKDFIAGPDGVPSTAVRKFHKQLMEKAIASLETQTIAERDMSSLMIPMDAKKIELARKRIRDFRVRLCKELSEGDDLNALYCLSIGFFNLADKGRTNGH